jgi:hypothetical protein
MFNKKEGQRTLPSFFCELIDDHSSPIKPLILSKEAGESPDSSVVCHSCALLAGKSPQVFAKSCRLFSETPHVFSKTCGAFVFRGGHD